MAHRGHEAGTGHNGTTKGWKCLGMDRMAQQLGAGLQIIGTGLIPFIRNHGGSFYAMFSMIAGFVTNIILDYLFVWVLGQGVGDGSQPLISRHYGERDFKKLRDVRKLAYGFSMLLYAITRLESSYDITQ